MRTFKWLKRRRKPWAFKTMLAPLRKMLKFDKPLESRGYRPLQMTFDDQLKALIFFHLEEYESGRELLEALDKNDFAKECVAPPKGIKKSAFFEAINNRGHEQLGEVFSHLVGTYIMVSKNVLGADEADEAASYFVQTVSVGAMEDKWDKQAIFITAKSHPLKQARESWGS